MRRLVPLLPLLLVACGDGRGGANPICGFAALAGPTQLLEQFRTPNQTLSVPPARLPERTVARFAAGPALPAVVGRRDSLLVIGVDGTPPEGSLPQFGVLVVARGEGVKGVMLYETLPVEGAPRLGDVVVGSRTLPLLGIEVDLNKIQDPRCPPIFPDSLAQ